MLFKVKVGMVLMIKELVICLDEREYKKENKSQRKKDMIENIFSR